MSTARKPDAGLDVEQRIYLLKSTVRRELISVVAEHEELTLRQAAEHIAAREMGVDVDEITYDDQSGIFAMCSQNHVPTLEEHGVIEVGELSGETTAVLRATEVTHGVAELIELLEDAEIGGARA